MATGFEGLESYSNSGIGNTGFDDLKEDKNVTTWEKTKQFGRNIVNDTVDTAVNFGTNVSNAFANMNEMALQNQNSGEYVDTPYGQYHIPEKQVAQEYKKATDDFVESVKTPAMVAGMVAPAVALPYMASDIEKSYKDAGGGMSGVGQVVRDFTYGPVVDFVTQDGLGQKMYEHPVSTAIDGVMAVAPFVAGAKGARDAYKGAERPTGDYMLKDGEVVPVMEEVGTGVEDVKLIEQRAVEPIERQTGFEDVVHQPTENVQESLYQAIQGQESNGGDYNIVNPDSGAKGNIQWMPDTWREKAGKYLGDPDAEMTPQNQDYVGRAYINDLYAEYGGNERAVAAAIYGGEGLGKSIAEGRPLYDLNTRFDAEGNLDPNGKYPSVNEYIDQVLARKGGANKEPYVANNRDFVPREEPAFRQQEEMVDTSKPKEMFTREEEIKKDLSQEKPVYNNIELAEKIRSGEIDVRGRSYDQALYEEIKAKTPKEKVEFIKSNINELINGVKDPLGEVARVILDDDSQRAINGIAESFMRGHGEKVTISDKRVLATSIIKDTIATPDVILIQKNGRKLYMSYWQGANNMLHKVVVSTGERGDRGKIVTSHVVGDNPNNSIKSIKSLSKEIKNANEIIYVGDRLNTRTGQTEYPRQPASDRVSTLDTQLRPSDTLSITNDTKNVNSVIKDGDRQFMANRVEDISPIGDNSHIPSMDRAVTRKEIFDTIDNLFNQHVKSGRVNGKGVRGWFNTRTDVIRTKEFGDIPTSMHELGHYVDNRMGFSLTNKFDGEFTDVVNKRFGNAYKDLGIEGLRKEGFAEFFHDYTTNNSKAKAEFPEFYKHFENKLSSDKELKAKVGKLSSIAHQWYKQDPWERRKGTISFSEDKGIINTVKNANINGIKNSFNEMKEKAYTSFVDELNPIKNMVKDIENIIGEKIPDEINPYKQAWTARGWVGKAENLLEFGNKERGIRALKDIMSDIGVENHKDFSAYLVAMHDMDIHKWNAKHPKEAIFTDQKPIETAKIIEHYAKNENFVARQKELVAFQQNLLHELVEGGFIKPEMEKAMIEKYPNYAPFMRVFDEQALQSFASTKGYVNVNQQIKWMKGSSRDIVDPLESIIKNTFMFMNAIERNKVGASFASLAEHSKVGGIIEEVSGSAKAKDSTFSVWKNGEKKVYSTTPDILDAMKMIDKEGANILINILSIPANWLRAGATSLNH